MTADSETSERKQRTKMNEKKFMERREYEWVRKARQR